MFVASAAVFQPLLQAYSAIAEPSSWATLPKLNASLPASPNRFGPIWSVPMHGATASVPWPIASCTTGVAKSTSQVTNMMSAPPSRSDVAHAFAFAGSLFCVSQVLISRSRPSTPPSPLISSARIFAAASAGPSNGAIWPLESYAQPIVIGPDSCAPPPVSAAVAAPSASPDSSSSPPQPAATSASRTTSDASAAQPVLRLIAVSSRMVRMSPAPPTRPPWP